MNVGFLITARLKSTRLPMKVLLDLNGRTVIQRVIDRAKRIYGISDIVICTSGDPQDLPLFKIAKQEDIYAFAGHPDDVLKRLLDAARLFRMDYFVGITADNPLFSFEQGTLLVDWVNRHPQTDFAYYDNLPIGGNTYIVKTKILEVIYKYKPEGDTEIWGEWVKQPDIFNVERLNPPPQFDNLIDKNIRITLDEVLDYQELLKFYNSITTECTPNLHATAELISKHNLFHENKKVSQINVSEEYSKHVKNFYNSRNSEILHDLQIDRS